MSDVQLTISKEVVAPIVEAKIKEAILGALGGKESVIEKVVNEILNKKVSSNGTLSSYSSDNKYSWIDIVLTKTIQEQTEAAIKEHLATASIPIKEAIIKNLQSKKGAEMAAQALLSALNGTFQSSWTSSIKIDLTPKP